MRIEVRNILKPSHRTQSQYAAGGDHGESQPSLPADVGQELGENDGHQRREHHNRQQVRRDERDEQTAAQLPIQTSVIAC